MIVTVGKIFNRWQEQPNSLILNIRLDHHGTILTDNIISDNIEMLHNEVRGKYVYIYDAEDVPNNIVLGPEGRRTGRLVLWNDGTIRIAQNNHTEVGIRVNIE